MPRPFPPVKPAAIAEQNGSSYSRLVVLMKRLLAPDGCPWDQEQDYGSLRRYVLEEAAEVVDAIDGGDRGELCEELGDLLLQVVFLSELAQTEGAFGHDDVVAGIVNKLVRRHPHVFADQKVDGPTEVLQNWEQIKAVERAGSGNKHGGVLGGVPRSLPALVRAQRLGEKVAAVGFDWPSIEGARKKLGEELEEFDTAIASGGALPTGAAKEAIEDELGDVLFCLCNMARYLDLDAEAALRKAGNKFVKRFLRVEEQVNEKHGGFVNGKLPLEVLDGYWALAKDTA